MRGANTSGEAWWKTKVGSTAKKDMIFFSRKLKRKWRNSHSIESRRLVETNSSKHEAVVFTAFPPSGQPLRAKEVSFFLALLTGFFGWNYMIYLDFLVFLLLLLLFIIIIITIILIIINY